jgi:hypothetical protein
MNTGIQILIERMKTNPEEFTTPRVTVSDKWESLLKDYWKHLPEEDKAAYQQARDAMIQDEFTEMVMKKLAGVPDADGVALSSKTLPPSVGTLRVNPNTNQYEIFDGNQWIVTNNAQQLNPNNLMYGQQSLRVSTQNNDINQLQNSYQKMQQLGAGGSGGGTIYAGGGGGGSMLGNLAKNLGFK